MHPLSRALLLCVGLLMLAGCGEPVADIGNPKRYDKDGLSFLYPGNWKISEDETLEGGIHHLEIETKGDALVVVQIFPLSVAQSLDEYSHAFSTAAAAAVPMGKVVDIKFAPLPAADGFTRVKESFTMKLLNEAIPHGREFRSRDFPMHRCFLICQVAEEDLQKSEAGFKQVAESLQFEPPAEQKAP